MSLKRDKYDKVVSDLIRAKNRWRCENCKKFYPPGISRIGLHCSHFITRANQATRYDMDNVDSLCFYCHNIRLAGDPPAYVRFKKKKLGEERYKALLERKVPPKKWHPGEKEKLYKKLKKELEKYGEGN